MKSLPPKLLLCVALIVSGFAWSAPNNNATRSSPDTSIVIDLKGMKYLGSVDERYQSYNVEMAEVVGGRFWRPYKTMDSLPSSKSSFDFSNEQMFRKLSPANLSDKRLLNLAKGLAPAYVRVSGSWTNTVYFQDNEDPATTPPPGFVNTLTRNQWKGVIDFIKATHSKLITSFAVSKGVRDANGNWTPAEAQKIANYTKQIGGEISGAELFNEPTIPMAGGVDTTYDAQNFARDIAVFTAWAKKELPHMLLIGPGSTAEGIPGQSFSAFLKQFLSTDALMSATPKPVFDVFSYHYYGAVSMRVMQSGPFSIKADKALSGAWLQKTTTVADYYIGLRDKYSPGTPIWLTETAQASGGGDPFAATYLDCFRYLYQLGSMAKKGVKVVMHNTLAASEYSLVDQDSHLPKPNYWAALLWTQLMGTKVYEAGTASAGIYLFAHNTKGRTHSRTLLVLNTNTTATSLTIPTGGEQFTLTSDTLQGETVQLNGKDLQLLADDNLPAIKGIMVKAGTLSLPARSISFVTLASSSK